MGSIVVITSKLARCAAAARLDFGEVEDVVDDVEESIAGAADGFSVLGLLCGESGGEKEIGHADHAVHRGADLVTHVGQEFALHAGDFNGLLA